MHDVKRNALAGRAFRDIHDGNRHLLRWCLEVAGCRVHGTTKQIPLEIFDQLERVALLPLPLSPWELAEWKQAKLHADCHVVFGGAYYSAPHRLIGERLWVRAAGSKIELFHEHARVATHRRARPGQRRTLVAHLPPEKVHFLMQTPAWCHERAAEIGPACALFIDALLGDRPLDRLRTPSRPSSSTSSIVSRCPGSRRSRSPRRRRPRVTLVPGPPSSPTPNRKTGGHPHGTDPSARPDAPHPPALRRPRDA